MANGAIIVDADTLLYRIGFQYLGDDADSYIGAISTYIDNVIGDARDYYLATYGNADINPFIMLSGEGERYRTKFDQESTYKIGRWNAPKPKFVQEMKDYLRIKKYPSNTYTALAEWGEADDLVSCFACDCRLDYTPYIIAGCDKDLLQIPGWHYNYLKKTCFNISKEEALKNFFKQLLMGDQGDSIPGIPGIGPKKAAWLLDELNTSEEMWDGVLAAYTNFYAPHGYSDDDIADMLYERGNKLWLKRKYDEVWTPPVPTED